MFKHGSLCLKPNETVINLKNNDFNNDDKDFENWGIIVSQFTSENLVRLYIFKNFPSGSHLHHFNDCNMLLNGRGMELQIYKTKHWSRNEIKMWMTSL